MKYTVNLFKCMLIVSFSLSGVAEAQLRNAPQSLRQRVTARLGIEQETKIVQVDAHWVLSDDATQTEATLRELSRWSGRSARGRINPGLPVVVDDLLPRTILENPWVEPLLNGPNCHNNTLMTLGLYPRRMYVGNDEMTFYLQNFCRRLQGPAVNAIGILRTGTSIDHSYIVVSDRLTFEKRDNSRSSAPGFKNFTDRRRRMSEFFRCEPRNLSRGCEGTVLSLAGRVDALHRKMEDLVFKLRNSWDHDDFLRETRDLESHLERERSCASYRGLLRVRLRSIYDALIEFEKTGAYIGRGSYDTQPRY